MRNAVKVAGVAASTALVLSGCGGAGQAPAGGDGYPTSIQNCGHEVRIDRKPERIVALGPSEVATLQAAGAAPKLVGRDDAGAKSDPYPPQLRAAVASVPQLGQGGEVTRENVIDLQPDLVVGSVTETVTPETLGAVGIPMVSLAGNCGSNHAPGTGDGTADFDDVATDLETLGRLAGTSEQASAAVADMRGRVAGAKPPPAVAGKSAAAAIVFQNGFEVYGRQSMAHTQLQALGLRDVFGDAPQRVFEASVEDLINRNPDVVMLLSYGESDAAAKEKFLRIPGAANLTAVRNNALFVQPYEFSSQGVLAVNGLENMSRSLAAQTNPR